ncbi:MAG: hypothetical protein AAGI52_11720 [Bacteroidota bacterium]
MSHSDLSERQAADLLRRAAQLQARADESHGPGLTMDEVKRAAQAAGIDPTYVEQAALGAGDDLPPSDPFLGMQTGSRQTRIVAGEVSDAEWGKMVATLRRQLGGTGGVETIGGVREWRRAPYHILLEPEGKNTRVTASATWRADTMGAVALTAMLLGFALLMVAMSFAGGKTELVWLAATFGAMGGASGLFAWPRLWAKGPRIDAKLDRALDALEELAGSEERAEVLAEAPELPSPLPEEPRLNAALLEDLPHLDAEVGTPERRRERG